MTPLEYVSGFPVAVNRLKITSAVELQILIWAAALRDGLRQSNSQLSSALCTDKRTIINSINRLKEKGYITNTGTKFHRVLVANSEIVSLFNSERVSLNGEIVSPVNSEKVAPNGESLSLNGERCDTHNIRKKETEYNICEKASTKPFRKPTPEQVTDYAATLGFTLDGENFCDHYESKGWLIGKTKMQDWQAAVRTWKTNAGKFHKKQPLPKFNNEVINDGQYTTIHSD